MSIDFKNLMIDPISLVCSCLYLILGGKDIMGTFNFDFNLFQNNFLSQNSIFPIPIN